ncbi:hypothetical protein QYE76_032496 [Lolium multiflorum]|uniref:Retrotransposon protein, putative, unclassified n=1 Tax=Lolium multiflorum TaxID=4521 RepID=A0AAD8VLF0_LOLMU|nr:hypothetical protein QYE76_032496 [Lolium multiflorum]
MYRALDHITEGAAPSNPDDTWLAVDIHISLWFLATLSDDLHRLVVGADGRACSTWLQLQRFFLDKSTSRYLYLSKAFHNCPRGDLSVSDYASKLQGLADDLAAIDRPVDDRDLTSTFLDGLGEKFKLQAEVMKANLPSFTDACSRLQHAEIAIDTPQTHPGAQAMAVHSGGSSDRGGPSVTTGQPRYAGVSPNYRGKNPIPGFVHPNQRAGHATPGAPTGGGGRGRSHTAPGGRGSGDSGYGRGGGQHPWVGYFAPVGAPFPPRAPWVVPNASSVLGSRPGAPTQAYPVMYAPAPPPAAPITPAPPTYGPSPGAPPQQYQTPAWDLNTMYQSAPSYGSAFPTTGGDWVMDSGATAHVTGNPATHLGFSEHQSANATSPPTPRAIPTGYRSPTVCNLYTYHDLVSRYPDQLVLHPPTRFAACTASPDPTTSTPNQPQLATFHHSPATRCRGVNVVSGKWIYRHKLHPDGSLARYKASLAGALQYLTLTRPDLSHAVQQICLFMHDPRESHLQLVKRILRYVKGTPHLGLQLHVGSSTELVAYSDADWAGCPDTHRSTSGFGVFLGENLVSWSSKRQNTVSRSSAEAEYRAIANCLAETVWLRQLLVELHQAPSRATIVYCDNLSATYMSTNPVQHQRTKHVEIDLHFVRDRVALGEARILHVPTSSQYADIFTKGLPTSIFHEFRTSLNVVPSPVSTAGGC